MRNGQWRAERRHPRKSEVIIPAGRRQYWTLLMIESQVQVEGVLNGLGVP